MQLGLLAMTLNMLPNKGQQRCNVIVRLSFMDVIVMLSFYGKCGLIQKYYFFLVLSAEGLILLPTTLCIVFTLIFKVRLFQMEIELEMCIHYLYCLRLSIHLSPFDIAEKQRSTYLGSNHTFRQFKPNNKHTANTDAVK